MSERRTVMVEKQIVARGVTDARVLEAMRCVPRHRFVPPDRGLDAYEDQPLPIGHGQTISQPYIVGAMTELAMLTPQSRVLEVGTGSGYQTAVLAELAAEVFSIEIVEPLAREARKRLGGFEYDNIHLLTGDGSKGWESEAPFDVILVTAAPQKLPTVLVEQLAEGGRLVIPIGTSSQKLVVVTREEGSVREREVFPVRFVPMTGKATEQD